jgi:hypothetical protein
LRTAALAVLAWAWAAAVQGAECTPIAALPFHIDEPGAYCLASDLAYDGSGTGAAIMISAPDVDLDLGGFTLAGPGDPGAVTTGVSAGLWPGVRVHNGRLRDFRVGIALMDPGAGPVIEDVEVLAAHYVGLFAEGPGTVVRRCRVSNVGGSTLPDDTITVGIYVYGHGSQVTENTVVDVARAPGPEGEGVGIAVGTAVASIVRDNVIVNAVLEPDTWAVWLAPPNDTLLTGNFVAGYAVGIAFPSGVVGTYASNMFMNVTTPVLTRGSTAAIDAGGNRSFRAMCRPVYELPFTIAEPGRYCLVKNLSTAQVAGRAISIDADDVVLELGGFKVGGGSAGAGTATVGVHALDRRNVTVRGGNIRGFRRAVFLEETAPGASAGGHLVEKVLADTNTEAGIEVMGVDSTVRRNQVVAVGGATTPGPASVAIRVTGPRARVIANEISSAHAGDGVPLVGIHVVGADGAVVEANRVSLDPAADSTGVVVDDAADAILLRNRVVRAAAGLAYVASAGKYGRNVTVGVTAPFAGGTDIGGNN